MSIPFEQLPADTQKKIKDTLRAYDDVSVYFENGEYRFGTMLKESYAPDHRYVGTYYAKELFTEQERMLNYVNEFQCYPIEYKGKRNYADFHTGKNEVFTMDDDGNIVIKGSEKEAIKHKQSYERD